MGAIRMARSIFKRSLGILWLVFSSDACASGAMAVIDVQSLSTMKDVLTTSAQSLARLQSMTTEMIIMNNVLGGALGNQFLSQLSAVSQFSGEFGGLLSTFGGTGDPLSRLNYLNAQYGTRQDLSNYLYAKSYFKDRFFPEKTMTSVQQFETIQAHKLEAIETSTVSSLALSAQQKKTLGEDHQTLKNLSVQANSNPSLQYQTGVQTRLLEQIAYRLDKLIAIQSQQLELMAAYTAQTQPTLFRKAGGRS